MKAVRNQIGEAQKVASGGGSEVDRAEAQIELEVGTRIMGLCVGSTLRKR